MAQPYEESPGVYRVDLDWNGLPGQVASYLVDAGDALAVVEDGDEVRVGRRRLRAIDTPGHAYHHHAYHEPDAGLVFTGDVAGIRIDRMPYVSAPTPPPDIDLEAWQRSLVRLRELRPA